MNLNPIEAVKELGEKLRADLTIYIDRRIADCFRAFATAMDQKAQEIEKR